MTTTPLRYRARWILPVDAPPIENGTVEIEAGCIAALHAARVPRTVDLGNVALLPGLVNAHTHLEFSDCPRPLQPPRPFTDWIRAVIDHRRNRRLDIAECIRSGLTEARSAGTTTLGEIAGADHPPRLWTAAGLQGVLFREFRALSQNRIDEQLATARNHLTEFPAHSPLLRPGLSPHAPYSVHPDLYRRLVDLAADHHAPLAVHLAETEAERRLLADATGEFRTLLQDLDVWQPGLFGGLRPLHYLHPFENLQHGLIVHGNYLDDEELAFLADRPHLTLVYCPRTHAWFGHRGHPWRMLLERGGNVALGTDSRASNPDLSLWDEMRFLRRRCPDVDPAFLLELGTLRGARALGLDELTGSLAVGKSADLAVVRLPDQSATSPWSLLWTPETRVTRFHHPV